MIIGIDLGGTKIAAGIVRSGKIVKRVEIPTLSAEGKERVIAQMRLALNTLVPSGKGITAVGIGVPGIYAGTKVIDLPNIQALSGIDLKKALKLRCPVVVENDARCFALAEANGVKNAIGVIMGTGLGTGIIIDGNAYRGQGNAGELSRVIADLHTGRGDWESFFGGPKILARHHARGGKERTCSEIWDARTNAAQETKDETIHHIAMHMANLCNIFDPELIVFGGGVSRPDLIAAARKALPTYLPHAKRFPKVRVSAHGADAGILGAAHVAHKRS